MVMIKNRVCFILVSAVVAAIAFSVPAMGDQANVAGYPPSAAITYTAQHLTGLMRANALDNIIVASVTSSLGPGGKAHHIKKVDRYIETLNVDLKWANPDVSLRLDVYSPSGEKVGSWDDTRDDVISHEINVDINNLNGIEQGTWNYYVYYVKGVGSTDYTL
jgi:hypothetical protein